MNKKYICTAIILGVFLFLAGVTDVSALTCHYNLKIDDSTMATITITETPSFNGGTPYASIIYGASYSGVTSNGKHYVSKGQIYDFENKISSQNYLATSVQNYINDKYRQCDKLYVKKGVGIDLGIVDPMLPIPITKNYIKYTYTKEEKNGAIALEGTTEKVVEDPSETTDPSTNPEDPAEPLDKCGNLLSETIVNYLTSLFRIIQIAGPILAIVLGMLDFLNAVISNEQDSIKKASSKFIRRLIAAALLFLLPTILNFVISIINQPNINGTCI